MYLFLNKITVYQAVKANGFHKRQTFSFAHSLAFFFKTFQLNCRRPTSSRKMPDIRAGYTLALSDTVVPSWGGAFFEGTIYELTLQRREQEELFY